MPDAQMLLIGDTYVQRPDPDSAFRPNLDYFKDADIFFCNLETVIAGPEYLSPHDHDTRPRTDEAALSAYLGAGINVMNVANNPSTYHGLDCFLRSLVLLDQAGVVVGGGGRNLSEARKPAIIEKNGVRVAFVCRTSVCAVDAAATPKRAGVAVFRVATSYEPRPRHNEAPGSPPIIHTTPNTEDRVALQEDIQLARQQADVVVVSWHWGISSATGGVGDLVGYQEEMGRFAIDAGADLVVGHHPRMLQPIEVYKGKVIAYCLANYVHDRSEGPSDAVPTMLLQCTMSGGAITEVSFVPGLIEGHGPPTFYRPSEATGVVDYMRTISAPFGTQFETQEDRVSVVL